MQNFPRQGLELRNRNVGFINNRGRQRNARYLDQKEMCLSKFLFGQNAIKLFQEYSKKQSVFYSVCDWLSLYCTHFYGQYSKHWMKKVVI